MGECECKFCKPCKCKKCCGVKTKKMKFGKKWKKAAPGCSSEHGFDEITTAEGGVFKCQICTQTIQASEGGYRCQVCKIDVCKPCYEEPEPEEPGPPPSNTGQEVVKDPPAPPPVAPPPQTKEAGH